MITEREERQAWLAALPEVIRQARERWSLTIGEPACSAWTRTACCGGYSSGASRSQPTVPPGLRSRGRSRPDCHPSAACLRSDEPQLVGQHHGLPPAASEAAYRVVQEALTNALKHAPGAPVDITVRSQGAEVAVDVVNAPGRQRPSGLERSGSGYGLAGMRDRVAACGGSLTCGPTQAGG